MEDKQIKEILDDPQKLLNLLRLVHHLLHLYDQKEMANEIKRKGGTHEHAGLGDTLSVVLKDSKGNIKQEITERRS